jgi:hypothetical protein
MKLIIQLFFLQAVFFDGQAQTLDSCEMVSQNNQIGGLDCAIGFTGNFNVDSYQWLNCDNLFAPFPGDTSEFFSSYHEGSVALEITVGSCVDTSYCYEVCHFGINEQESSQSIQIFPNPSHDVIYFESGNEYFHRMEILDIYGNMIDFNLQLNEQSTFDVSTYNNGIYFIRIYSDQVVKLGRFEKL